MVVITARPNGINPDDDPGAGDGRLPPGLVEGEARLAEQGGQQVEVGVHDGGSGCGRAPAGAVGG